MSAGVLGGAAASDDQNNAESGSCTEDDGEPSSPVAPRVLERSGIKPRIYQVIE